MSQWQTMSNSYKGVNAKVFIPEVDAVYPCAYAESASVDIASNIEAAFTLGSAAPATRSAGNLDISGTLSGYWIDTEFVELLERDACWALLQTFSMLFYSNTCGVSPNAPYLKLTGCKADGLSFDFSQDGFLMHDLDFICTNWAYGMYT